MGENNNLLLQKEINQNMTVASNQPFAMSNEEQAFNRQQQLRGTFNRSQRKRTSQEKSDQQRDTQNWVNKANTSNILHIENAEKSRLSQDWVHNVGQDAISAAHRNNKASSENFDTIRENIKNSQESLKRRSCESLTIEQASLRNRNATEPKGQDNDKPIEDNRCKDTKSVVSNTNSTNNLCAVGSDDSRTNNLNVSSSEASREDNVTKTMDEVNKNAFSEKTLIENNQNIDNAKSNSDNVHDVAKSKRSCAESTDSLNESTCDLSRSYCRSLSIKDPHTAAIDLSNNCRQFYFNHLKSAEAIKQSVRSAKHTRAMEKMEGKPSSRIDSAMDRLRSEMADLMDQDLSLMSQLLKLNDKIEEVKTHVAYRHRQETFNSQSSCYLSNSEMSDSEFEDNDDSRLDVSLSARDFKMPTEPKREVVLRRMEPTDSRIIVYKKKKSRNGKRRARRSQSRPETEEETTDGSDESGDNEEFESDSHSDTESTLSQSSTINGSGSDHSGESADHASDAVDSGIQSPKQPDEPPKPKKGGISQNRRFLNFHKKNGNFTKSILTGLNVLTMQGHNVPLDKYYVPQGLVYLKQEKSDNVFCQFTK